MLETVSTEEDKNAIEVIFNSNKSPVPITIKAHTYAKLYAFVDIRCIKEIEMFFIGHLINNKIDISYYTEQAKIQLLKYINIGIDYMVWLWIWKCELYRRLLMLRRLPRSKLICKLSFLVDES